MGANGTDSAHVVGEIGDFYHAAHAATNGREVFRSAGAAGERKVWKCGPRGVEVWAARVWAPPTRAVGMAGREFRLAERAL